MGSLHAVISSCNFPLHLRGLWWAPSQSLPQLYFPLHRVNNEGLWVVIWARNFSFVSGCCFCSSVYPLCTRGPCKVPSIFHHCYSFPPEVLLAFKAAILDPEGKNVECLLISHGLPCFTMMAPALFSLLAKNGNLAVNNLIDPSMKLMCVCMPVRNQIIVCCDQVFVVYHQGSDF